MLKRKIVPAPPNGKHSTHLTRTAPGADACRIERFFVSVGAGEIRMVSVYGSPDDHDAALADAQERAAQFRRAQEEAER